MSETTRRQRSVALVAVVLALSLGACSDDAPDGVPDPSTATSDAASESAAPAPQDPPRETKATIRKVSGKLSPTGRESLRVKVTTAVDTWIDAAYLAGDYPRTDFEGAFATFTPGARVRARQDERLMTNAALGASVDSVGVLARRIRIDVLAVGGRPAAVTVDVVLGMALRGEVLRRERVVGDLYLTFAPGGWQVFGYDMSRGVI